MSPAEEIATMLERLREMRNGRTRTNEGDVEIWRAFNDAADRLAVLESKLYQRSDPE